MKKKLGLALGSGGSRGVAHVGLLQALEDEGIKPYCIAGSSIGAVVGGAYASGMPVGEMRKIISGIRRRDIISPNFFAFSETALLRTGKVHSLLKKHIKVVNIEDFPVKFACVATDVLSGRKHVFESGDAVFAIEASSAIPAVFKPKKLQDKLLVDGGCVCRVPVEEVKALGADVVIAMDVLKNTSAPVKETKGLLNMLLRVFDIMDAQNAAYQAERNRDICELYLEPEMEGLSQYAVKELKKAYSEGYALAKENMHRIKKLLE